MCSNRFDRVQAIGCTLQQAMVEKTVRCSSRCVATGDRRVTCSMYAATGDRVVTCASGCAADEKTVRCSNVWGATGGITVTCSMRVATSGRVVACSNVWSMRYGDIRQQVYSKKQ